MTQLELAATTVPMRHVQGSEPLAIPADALCVLAPGHDAARDHVVRDDARGGAWLVTLPTWAERVDALHVVAMAKAECVAAEAAELAAAGKAAP